MRNYKAEQVIEETNKTIHFHRFKQTCFSLQYGILEIWNIYVCSVLNLKKWPKWNDEKYRAFKKNPQISGTNEKISLSFFFLLKTQIHMKVLNIEPILCNSRRLRYLQNKTAFWSKQVHIHFVLKWSSQHQSSLEMPWLAPYWPGHSLRGLQGPQAALTGL